MCVRVGGCDVTRGVRNGSLTIVYDRVRKTPPARGSLKRRRYYRSFALSATIVCSEWRAGPFTETHAPERPAAPNDRCYTSVRFSDDENGRKRNRRATNMHGVIIIRRSRDGSPNNEQTYSFGGQKKRPFVLF